MKNYRVTVNGNVYDVTVEENTAGTYLAPATPSMQAVPVQQVVAAPVATPAAPPAALAPATPIVGAATSTPVASGSQGNIKISSPMPGKILKIMATAGQNVKKGETILILEAMKMENEIVAPQDGTVASIHVSVGSSVESGDLLATLN